MPHSAHRRLALLAVAILVLACPPREEPRESSESSEQTAAEPTVIDLFEPADAADAYDVPPGLWAEEEVLRSRVVRFEEKRFRRQVLDAPAKTLMLYLFPDVPIVLMESKVTEDEEGLITWKAADSTEHYTQLLATVSDSVMHATVRVNDRLYEIVPIAEGVVRIAEIEHQRFPDEAPPRVPPRKKYASPRGERSEAQDEPRPAGDGDGRLLVLAVLPEPAFSFICNTSFAGIDFLQVVENSLEKSLNNVYDAVDPSGVEAVVEAVCHKYDPVGGDLNDDLDFVTDDAGIAVLRDVHNADLVSLLVPSADYCGRGWEPFPVEPLDDVVGFSVVKASCAIGNFSFAHELGHNFGLRHDRTADDAGGSETCNYGHVFPVKLLGLDFDARTVMAYGSSCDDCPRFGLYSMPKEIDAGAIELGPFGVPCNEPASDGKFQRANNRQQLINAAPTVANYR